MRAGYSAELLKRQELIESSLRNWLARVTANAPPALSEAMSYSLFAGGKRLRPLLTLLVSELAGGQAEQSLPGACAVEMIHTYSLIHDDLPAMDDDDLRRGKPTNHKKYGEALAILAGDALQTAAFQVLAEGCPPKTAAVSIAELARGAGSAGMVGGQVLDLAAEGKVKAPAPQTVGDLQRMHWCKTGALFVSSLRLGLFAAQAENGVDKQLAATVDRFGQSFGLAFQIADDLLDVHGTEDRTGKRVGKDAERGKLTFPGLVGVDESRRMANRLYAEADTALQELGPPTELLRDLTRLMMNRDQ